MKKAIEENPTFKKKEIAKKMAIVFSKFFTAKNLISWHIRANHLLFEYYQTKESKEDYQAPGFLAGFEFYLIHSFLDAKSDAEKSNAIEEDLPLLFGSMCYKNAKKALAEIGQAFLFNYTKYRGDEEGIKEFWKPLGCFLELSEMYEMYELFQTEEYKIKEEKKLKAA